MIKHTDVGEQVFQSIREIFENIPVCEVCGGDGEECGCSEVEEDDDAAIKEPSGDKEEIVINPEVDPYSRERSAKVDEWTKAAKSGYLKESKLKKKK